MTQTIRSGNNDCIVLKNESRFWIMRAEGFWRSRRDWIWGYVKGLLREDRYNAIDTMILDTFHRALGGGKRIQKTNNIDRIKHFENFVLTMSDQQLVTGFALVIAAQLIRYGVADLDKTISAYSYCMAVNLALFSCVTHLSSMTVLRSHYDSNKRLRDIKTVLMVASVALLVPQLVAGQILATNSTLRCSLDQLGGDTGLHWYDDTYSKMVFFSTLSMIGILVGGYLRRILELYIPMFSDSPEAWVAEICASKFSWLSKHDIKMFNVVANLDRFAEAMSLLAGRNGIRDYFTMVSIIAGELRSSFFAEIVWFLFYSTFALCEVCFFIVWGGDSESSISFTPQFGQILPLGMLVLPVLSAVEAYRS
ncbi:uncharacterized protein N7479_000282 [Penicillium vulpinum]|uniref:uncharacterized protein n=1 Tax=Penicillium vulpinum TaxID=29845 RepID=UPI0025468A00|nr:uncharacterized protein N7479_000282 [Penicillium vulpinum]KAJ5970364.1 hypothetical protein N7479_000282 [Penicillium vulpinum]